jgi:hypothetical protein
MLDLDRELPTTQTVLAAELWAVRRKQVESPHADSEVLRLLLEGAEPAR